MAGLLQSSSHFAGADPISIPQSFLGAARIVVLVTEQQQQFQRLLLILAHTERWVKFSWVSCNEVLDSELLGIFLFMIDIDF